MSPILRQAVASDVAEIAALVNKAYRPTVDRRGWTHEADLVSGQRVSVAQVLSILSEGSTILLLCQPEIVACVQVQAVDSVAYIGMLATDPSSQAQGLGKRMLAHAEDFATEFCHAQCYQMSVLCQRHELIAFYERRGYVRTGDIVDYPVAAGVGQPIVADLQVDTLVKWCKHDSR